MGAKRAFCGVGRGGVMSGGGSVRQATKGRKRRRIAPSFECFVLSFFGRQGGSSLGDPPREVVSGG